LKNKSLLKASLILIFLTVFFGSPSITNVIRAQELPTEELEATVSATPPPAPINPVNLTLSPINIILETDPEEPVTSLIKILNNSLEEEYLELELQKFTADSIGSKPIIQEFNDNDHEQSWVSFDQDKFSVKPKEWKTIKVTFTPPADASLSYYYAILVKRQVAVDEQSSSVLTGVPAILMLTTVRSPFAKFELQLSEFLTTKKIYEFLPANFEVTIKNSGNTHIAPLGNIFIDRGETKDVAILSLNKEKGLILPGSERTYTVEWAEGFPFFEKNNEGEVESSTLKWNFSEFDKFRLGKYTAHLLFIYDNGERDIPVESKISFWVIPWRLILVVFFLVTFTIIGILIPILFVIKKLTKKNTKPELAKDGGSLPPIHQSSL